MRGPFASFLSIYRRNNVPWQLFRREITKRDGFAGRRLVINTRVGAPAVPVDFVNCSLTFLPLSSSFCSFISFLLVLQEEISDLEGKVLELEGFCTQALDELDAAKVEVAALKAGAPRT